MRSTRAAEAAFVRATDPAAMRSCDGGRLGMWTTAEPLSVARASWRRSVWLRCPLAAAEELSTAAEYADTARACARATVSAFSVVLGSCPCSGAGKARFVEVDGDYAVGV